VKPSFLLSIAAALVGIGITLFLVLENNKGSRMILEGKILAVNVIKFDEKSSGILVNFRITNPADFPYVTEEGRLEVELADKSKPEIQPVAASSVDQMLAYSPSTPRLNEALLPRTKLKPKQTVDRMLAFRTDTPADALEGRKALRLTIEEADGKNTVLEEKR
jgi:hypothetical protein